MPVTIDNCGGTLAGATDTISWTDTDNPIPSTRRYDIFVNGVDIGPSQLQPISSVEYNSFPTNCSTVEILIEIKDNGIDTSEVISCNMTSAGCVDPEPEPGPESEPDTLIATLGCPTSPINLCDPVSIQSDRPATVTWVSGPFWSVTVDGIPYAPTQNSSGGVFAYNPVIDVPGVWCFNFQATGDDGRVYNTEECCVTVNEPPTHDGCPTEDVELGTPVTLTANHTLTDSPVTYEHTVKGVLQSQTGQSITLPNDSIGTCSVITKACTVCLLYTSPSPRDRG